LLFLRLLAIIFAVAGRISIFRFLLSAFRLFRVTSSRTTKVLALSLGTFLTQLVGLVSGVVVARILTREDLATYRQTFLAFNFTAPLLTLALPSALYFFLPRKPGHERTVLVSNLLLLCAMSVVFSGFLLLGGAHLLAWRFNNPALEPTLKLLALYPLFTLPASALEACLVARNQVTMLAIYNILSRLLLTCVLIGVCVWVARPDALVVAQVAVAGAVLVPAVFLMFRFCRGGEVWLDATLMREMLKYSVPLGLATMLGTMTLQLASVIVSSMCTPEEFAIYSVGAVEIPLIGIVTGSITTVVLADMSRLVQEGNKAEALRLFQMAALRSAAVLLPAMVFFLIAAEPFIEGLYSAKYHDSIVPFRLYLLILPIRIVTYGAALMALGMTKTVLFRSVVDFLLNALFCAVLVHFFGYLGGAFSILAVLYSWTSLYNLHTIGKGFNVRFWQVLPFRKFASVLGIALIAGLPAGAVGIWVHWPNIPKFVLLTFVYWPLVMVLLHRFGHLPHIALAENAMRRGIRFFFITAT
jgi:O-antigen/teichoic acid export membrane protein